MSTALPSRSLPRLLGHVLVLAAAGLLCALGSSRPALAAPAAPQLSISVDDGQAEARSTTTLRYTLTVTNLGSRPVRDLVVSQTVPTGTRAGRVADGGKTAKGAVRWTTDVPGGRSITLHTSIVVGPDLPADLFRLATVACAATSSTAAPTVCASDSDQLPAGAAVVAQQRDLGSTGVAARPAWLLPAGLAAGGLLVGGALVVTAVRLQGGRRRSTAEGSS